MWGSVMVSAKFFDDSYLNNRRYAHLGGVTTHELNMLEVEFLFLIDFNLFVSSEEYIKIYQGLCFFLMVKDTLSTLNLLVFSTQNW